METLPCVKLGYRSAGQAYKVLKRMRATNRHNGRGKENIGSTVYFCTMCDQWHLGRKMDARDKRLANLQRRSLYEN